MNKRAIINLRGELLITSILLLFFSYFKWMPFRSYIDDFVCMLFFIPFITGVLKKRYKRIERKAICLLSIICVIGCISNYIHGVVTNIAYIANDLLSFVRIFVVYFGVLALLREKKQSMRYITNKLGILATVFIIVAFVFGILNFFGIVKMFSTIRYGLKNYHFYFGNASQFGVFVGCSLALMIFGQKNKRLYEIMAIVCLILTFKGMGLIIASIYISLLILSKKKLKLWQFIVVLGLLIIILRYQIVAYLFNASSPRAILIRYGIVSAISFFPIGGGFATYGSNMAAVHYSPLYIKYGFHLRKALTIFDDGNGPTTYLNDAYLGMSFGQFGFFGTALLVFVFFLIGKRFLVKHSFNKKAQFITIACFGCFCGMSVMAGSIKTSCGEFLMMVFALYVLINENNNLKKAGIELSTSGELND